MSEHTPRRSPEEIETDIYETRARLDDTLHELEARLSPQRLVDTAFDYVRQGGANDVMARVGRVVKRNPYPVVLTGIGLGWLAVSQYNAQRKTEQAHTNLPVRQSDANLPVAQPSMPVTDEPPRRSVGASATGPETTGAGTTSTGKDPASVGASATYSSATPPVGEAPPDIDDSSRRNAGKEKARHMTDNVKGRAQSMNNSFRERASSVRNGSQSAMRNAGARAQGAGTQSLNFIQEHPIVAGAIGVAIGAALGSMFPTTRVENERVGRYRDRAMNKAAEAGRQQADMAQHKVHEKAEQAKSGTSSDRDESTDNDTPSSTSSDRSSTTGTGGSTGTGSSANTGGSGSDHTPTRGG
ncbi:DUF3618 domain-containing protein [Modicisalibacter luteus]|uniref:DUF3618 domain-containing protein n=1 Tax=Modicisalibacter luteus TaxID=453962 RepID=A0ABV7M3X3_9GAMM|nr:DUF3618 domain-containing protein [Halomonas lutea]GHA87308.1 hypothetical protein GCM10007159_05750 [Halomonas lutea]